MSTPAYIMVQNCAQVLAYRRALALARNAYFDMMTVTDPEYGPDEQYMMRRFCSQSMQFDNILEDYAQRMQMNASHGKTQDAVERARIDMDKLYLSQKENLMACMEDCRSILESPEYPTKTMREEMVGKAVDMEFKNLADIVVNSLQNESQGTRSSDLVGTLV
jgi:hypothetical protein